MKRMLFGTLSGLILLIAASSDAPAQQFDGPGIYNVDSLLEAHPLAKDQPSRSDEIGYDSLSSVHLIQVRDAVPRHHHAHHDENVIIVRGAGQMELGGVRQRVKAGDVIHIPRGTPHAFHSLGSVPAVAIVVYAPGFDPKDRIPHPDSE